MGIFDILCAKELRQEILFIGYALMKEAPNHDCESDRGHWITKHYLCANRPDEETGVPRVTHELVYSMSNQFVTLVVASPNKVCEGVTGRYDCHLSYDFAYYNHCKPRVANPPVFLQLREQTNLDEILQQREEHCNEVTFANEKRSESDTSSPMKGDC